MKRRTFIQLGLIAVPVAGGIIACNDQPKPQTTPTQSAAGFDQVIKIGSVLTLTGAAALLGKEMQAGQKLAADYWNSKGAKVELVFEDSKNQPKDGLSGFQSLKARGVKLFTANGSGVCLAIKPEIKESEATFLAMAAHPAITAPVVGGVFRYSTTALGEADALFKWIQKSGSKDTVLIFHSADDYGVAFANALQSSLKSINIAFVVKPYRKEDIPEMRSLVQSSLPQSGYLPVVIGAGQPMAQVITVLRSLGYQGTVLANLGYALTGVQQQLGAEAGKVGYIEVDLPKNADLDEGAKLYKTAFGKDITPDAAIGFNSISLLVSACRKVSASEPSKINPELIQVATDYFSVKEKITNNEITVGVKVREA